MDTPELFLEKLERFNVQKTPEINRELDEYISFVARTGESVFNWTLVKKLYREKLINVITEFYNETKELPQYPNVDPFNYETMKKMLIERLDTFNAAPFTIQRISELLSDPRKQYSRIDKFMRAVEKNILVVSTVSPSRNNRSEESENGDSLDSVGLNGDFSSDVNVDIDMDNEEGSFTMTKEFNATTHRKESKHEVVTESHESITIKKIASKEEQASTSTVAINISNGEPLQPTQTDVKIEIESTVTITLSEPAENKVETEATTTDESSTDKSDETIEQEKSTTQDTVIKSDMQHEPITLLTESVEPKVDDTLLNEPLRPVDDETLPENPETTPLAALESIVANRVEIAAENTVKPDVIEEPIVEDVKETIKDEQIEQELEKSEEVPPAIDDDDDDSGIEAKRLKIEEIETVSEITVAADTLPTKPEPQIKENQQEPIMEEPKESPQQLQNEDEIIKEIDSMENTAVGEIITPPIETVIDEVKEDIPIVEEPIPIIESVTEPAVIDEPLPIVQEPITAENTMALDEDIANVPEIAPIDETESAAKMDTDEIETAENVSMDTDETEEQPMDQ